MECKDYRNLLIDSLLGETSREESRALEEHLASCDSCRREREAYSRTLDMYKSLADVEPTSKLDAGLRALAPSPPRALPRVFRLNWWQNTLIWSAASAACVVFVVWLARHTAPPSRRPRLKQEYPLVSNSVEKVGGPVAVQKPEENLQNGKTIRFAGPEDLPRALPVVIDIDNLLPDQEPCDYLVSEVELQMLRKIGVREEADEAGLFGVAEGLLAQRTQAHKQELVYTYLGHGTQQHVGFGLAWLAAHQSRSGAWGSSGYGAREDLAVETTALTLLAFLADGSSHQGGDYQEEVTRALAYLLDRQSRTDLFGGIGPRFMHGQTLATLALVEMLLLTSDDSLLDPIAKGLKVILEGQHKDGGWGTGNRPGRSDTLVTGWVVMLLKEARSAGLEVPDECFSGASLWFHRTTDYKGRIGRAGEGDFPGGDYHSTTAAGLFAKQMLGWPKRHMSLRRAERLLGKHLPRWDKRSRVDLTYVYFGSLAMFQRGGEAWQEWNLHLKDALMFKQLARGSEIGSWPAVRDPERGRDRIYTTAMAVLALQVYYKYPVLSE